MSVELVASVIQGQVVAVFYTEKAGACQQLDQSQALPHNTPSPQTVTTDHGTTSPLRHTASKCFPVSNPSLTQH